MTVTPSGMLVLALVRLIGPASAYDVKRSVVGTVDRFWSLNHAQIYAQCNALIAGGLLEQEAAEGGRRRRLLSITPQGGAVLDEWLADPSWTPVEARDLGVLKLFFGADPRVLAPTQLVNHRRQLAEYLALADDADRMPAGMKAGLAFGINYSLVMIDFWQTAAADAATGQGAQRAAVALQQAVAAARGATAPAPAV